jgi:hypothetical protein
LALHHVGVHKEFRAGERGVGIGYMERDRVDPVHLSQIGDFKFIYGVIERDQPHFAGKTLDMQDGRLVLVN